MAKSKTAPLPHHLINRDGQKALIRLYKDRGTVEILVLPVLHITTTGVQCLTGPLGSPASEWFPFLSGHCTATVLDGKTVL